VPCLVAKNFCKICTIVLSFVFDKYCLIIDREEFAAISISHCNREYNSVSHELARLGLVDKSSFVWIDDPCGL